MSRVTPSAVNGRHDPRSPRHASAVWLVGLFGLVVTAPTAVRAAVPPPPALDMEIIRQLAHPQAAPVPVPGTASPRPAVGAAPVASTGSASTGDAEPGGATEDAAATTVPRTTAVPVGRSEARPVPTAATGPTPRPALDVALIRQLAQPQAAPAPLPATPPAEVAVPETPAPQGQPIMADAPGEPVDTAVTADPVPSRAQPAGSADVSVPPGKPTAPQTDRPAGQPAPLDRRVIASLVTGGTVDRQEGGRQVTGDAETAPSALPQTQLDLIKGVFAPEMQD